MFDNCLSKVRALRVQNRKDHNELQDKNNLKKSLKY